MKNKKKSSRERANITENPFVGKQRYELYKRAIKQFNQAIEAGFYLEAITICESLIADRLESRCGELGKPIAFKPLGDLIKRIKQIEVDDLIRNVVQNDLDIWRLKRNTALHEIVKFEKGAIPNWENRVEQYKEYAEAGIEIFRKIDLQLTKLRKRK
jgi:hypothetical protein